MRAGRRLVPLCAKRPMGRCRRSASFAVLVRGCAARVADGDPADAQVDLLGSDAAVVTVVATSSDSVACALSGRTFLRYRFLCAADAMALAR
jgi:hypothetical protein